MSGYEKVEMALIELDVLLSRARSAQKEIEKARDAVSDLIAERDLLKKQNADLRSEIAFLSALVHSD